MPNWPALILFFCAYLVGLLTVGAYQGAMPDGYRWLMLVLCCVGLFSLGAFIWSLRPRGQHESL